mgnify:CR=1 FL=1
MKPIESISVFDMLKIGVGPSSSHTLGPWRAGLQFLKLILNKKAETKVLRIRVDLYGSLSLTGKGHATDIALMMGLSGADPVTYHIDQSAPEVSRIKAEKNSQLNQSGKLPWHGRSAYQPGYSCFCQRVAAK